MAGCDARQATRPGRTAAPKSRSVYAELPARGAILALGLLMGLLAASCAIAGAEATGSPPARLEPSIVARLFPDQSGPLETERSDGNPPVWKVSSAAGAVGFVASTAEVSGSIGYSGQPIDILVGISPAARITGAELIAHSEPVLTLGISSSDISRYVQAFAGFDLTTTKVEAFKDTAGLPPIIARATVSTGVIRDAILRTARSVALGHHLIESQGAVVDRVSFTVRSWDDLVKEGSITHAELSIAEAARRFGVISNPLPESDAPFVDLWLALLDPPTIGGNLLGQKTYTRSMASLGTGDSAILVASSGMHSHRGTNYQVSGIFDRIEVIQSEKTIQLRKEDYSRIDKLPAPNAPAFKEVSLFRLSPSTGFKPAEPFRIEVSAERDRPDGTIATLHIPLGYELPKAYRKTSSAAPSGEEPLWVSAWRRKPATIVIVVLMTVLVAVMFFAQESFVHRPRVWRWTRSGFLLFVLIFLGWIANGQLSVVQVVTFVHAILNKFRWETFLIEPVIFLLWCFVALGLLFLGRGVYCGWLCPFGALQELLNEGAKLLGVKQIEIPFAVQERLWAIKYTVFVLILGLSFHSMEQALILAEVEPFKTTFSMRFMRSWPFVLYVIGLLIAGLFIERFFCRYLCPLGAALGIPAKNKLFDWLHRRPQCGRECRFCETQCTVGAIDPLGRINPNECILCLRCQVIMHDDSQCVVLKRRTERKPDTGPAGGAGAASAANKAWSSS